MILNSKGGNSLAQLGIITVTIFNFINIWNEYFISLIFVNSDSLRPVAVGLFSISSYRKKSLQVLLVVV